MNKAINTAGRVAGFFKLEAFRQDADGHEIPGSRRVAADWFPNLITDAGLEAMGTSSTGVLTAYCRVGSGTAAPAFTDTALAAHVAASNTTQASTTTAQASPPYYGSLTLTKRFAAGVAAGNLSEVGMASAATTGTLYSRARILDGLGAPTTITVLADEVLDVTYELRNYPPLGDSAWSATIGGVNYSGVVRAASVTSVYWAGSSYAAGHWASGGNTVTAYNGAINAAITGAPAGTSSARLGANATYAAMSKVRDFSATWGLNDGNLAGGITAFLLFTAHGYYQVSVSPAIPKDATKTLTMTFRCGPWGRYTP
jgi:hypothetical protein